MNINLVEICRLKYPGQIEAGNITFRQPDDDILIGTWKVEGVRQPLEADLLAEAPQYQKRFELNAFQIIGNEFISAKLNSVAQERQYSDSVSCTTYSSSTNANWKAESLAFIAWRDVMYTYAINVFALIGAGGVAPTEAEFIAGFPVIAWPI